jgi:hypothetical protein
VHQFDALDTHLLLDSLVLERRRSESAGSCLQRVSFSGLRAGATTCSATLCSAATVAANVGGSGCRELMPGSFRDRRVRYTKRLASKPAD